MLEVPKLDKLVKETFCKLGNSIEITPVFGARRTIKLNRTIYHIDLSGQDLRVEQTSLVLPTIRTSNNLDDGELEKYVIELVSTNIGDIYCVKSQSNNIFKLNGNYTTHAYLRHGDEILLGRNKLKICPPLSHGPSEEDLLDIHPKLNVLIQGETGTGKSYLARKLHKQSGVNGEFVHLNLSAYSKGTLESELFGHVKGSFTGATSDKEGAFKAARNGTLFLDEIDSISIEMQTKLLLFLDDGLYYPVGSNHPQFIETRIIVASGQSLAKLVEEGKMRRDFYFRISSEEVINLDPLCRSEQKLKRLLLSYENQFGITIHPKLKRFYYNYEWPGNIRQLNAHLKKKKLKSKSKLLTYCEIDESLLGHTSVESIDNGILSYREMKYRYFLKVYNRCDQCVAMTARQLKVSNQTVRSVLSV